jgi:hypothetical protein
MMRNSRVNPAKKEDGEKKSGDRRASAFELKVL